MPSCTSYGLNDHTVLSRFDSSSDKAVVLRRDYVSSFPIQSTRELIFKLALWDFFFSVLR